jgi:hypothetical protein
MKNSRFQNVVMLDDGSGVTEKLLAVLTEAHPSVHFSQLYAAFGSRLDFPIFAAKFSPIFQLNSLAVGVGLTGLFALTMQERSPQLNLSAFAIDPPPEVGLTRIPERVVLCSNQPLKTGWMDYTDLAFDVPWLSGGVQGAIYAVSYMISAHMRGLDLRKEIASLPSGI